MSGSRLGAIARATSTIQSGAFVEALARLVEIRSESQNQNGMSELERYSTEGVAPLLSALGFETRNISMPQGIGPLTFAQRVEDPSLPTVLLYGHGDVVLGQAGDWSEGLDPWRLTVRGDKIYGRGTADNKGQHLIAIQALAAILAERGKLGFNIKVLIESGEELGSPGIKDMLSAQKCLLAADVFIALDGPRQSLTIPEMRLGARGGVTFDLAVNLRENVYHSGHWGGAISDAGIILAAAITSMVDQNGVIKVAGWRPKSLPSGLVELCSSIKFDKVADMPDVDPNWGEPGLSKAEKIYTWTSVIVLAFKAGRPEAPINAVQGKAQARIQVRHDVAIDGEKIIPELRSHLDVNGFSNVQIVPLKERITFPASRTDPADPWVRFIGRSLSRTTGHEPNIVPNSSGGNPSGLFQSALQVPVVWIPNSYAGCGQHGPDEHMLKSLAEQGLAVMAGLFWDIGSISPEDALRLQRCPKENL